MAKKESLARRRQRSAEIYSRLRRQYPDARCSLNYRDPLELLVATILAAQCTDERVNVVTKDLFRKYRSAEDYAAADPEALQQEIRTCGFFRNKAKSIQQAARQILERHGGRVPRTMEELIALPGVARKTANVVLGNAYGINEGVTVDTHVTRVAGRLRLTAHDDPVKIERDLMELLPREEWCMFSHVLVFHGRRICAARKPRCADCPVSDLCPSAFTFDKPG